MQAYLDQKEQNHVRAALRMLHRRVGAWGPVADGIHCSAKMISCVLAGSRDVSAGMAIRVARLLGVMVDDLLVGKFLPPGACPNCGHVAVSDFKDENTVVEGSPRMAAGGGLTVVK